ncbi:hypothetical protein GDO86_001200 [Hymenochirus boettgeri]|uniref:Solute carrier family 46 member 2 n=1 Tax=Hymenochirus boettgeri TaxID=247094 RepID=A0A8T2KEV5_9PIPI|nr:hypothetical protein GDO86_001200 [Hymenochirus boettgeri]
MNRSWVEPVVACAQIASSFYDTGLLIVVKGHYNQTLLFNSSSKDAVKKAISNFYMIHNLILGLTPLLCAYALGHFGDKKNRKIPICVPLAGYIIARMFLLFVILFDWPIEVMFGSAALNGLTGYFTTYWPGILAVASIGSSETRRSLRLIVIELVYGMAGLVGSLTSGHIFCGLNIAGQKGSVLVIISLIFYAFSLFYSLFILKMPSLEENGLESSRQLISETQNIPTEGEPTENSRLLNQNVRLTYRVTFLKVSASKFLLGLLFITGIMYNSAVNGAVDILPLFIIQDPLNWDAVEVGYANSAGYLIFVTSFLGVYFFSKRLTDFTMIIIGIVSFSAGIFIMGFVQWTFLFYIARTVMLFSLIPMPTIRSVISKNVQGSSYGKMFVAFQLSLSATQVITLIVFTHIYQVTLHWFCGFCFILSSIIAILSIIPLSIYMRQSRNHLFQKLEE